MFFQTKFRQWLFQFCHLPERLFHLSCRFGNVTESFTPGIPHYKTGNKKFSVLACELRGLSVDVRRPFETPRVNLLVVRSLLTFLLRVVVNQILSNVKCRTLLFFSCVTTNLAWVFLSTFRAFWMLHLSLLLSADSSLPCSKKRTPFSLLNEITCLLRTKCFPFQYLSMPRNCSVLTMSLALMAVCWLRSRNVTGEKI